MKSAPLNSSFESGILDLLPDAIIWVTPETDNQNNIIDFHVGYSNKGADEIVRHPKGTLKGLSIRKDGIPTATGAESNFNHFLEVYQTGEAKEYRFSVSHSNIIVETTRRNYMGGVLSCTRDRREQREAEKKEQWVRRILYSVIRSSPIGIVVFDAVRDNDERITDFRVSIYNDRSNELIGISKEERQQLSLKEILKELNAESFFEMYVQLVETGVPFDREQYVASENKWLFISSVRLEDGCLIMLTDITELKESQQSLRKQSEFLSSILNASLNAVFSCEAIRDESNNITDFRYTQINDMYKEMMKVTDEEVIGKTMLELYPGTEKSGAFQKHVQVVETGVPCRFEVCYRNGTEQWFEMASVKMGKDGVVVTFADITQKKKIIHEIEQQKNLLDNILKNSSNGISVTRIIRNDAGKIIDGIAIIANDAAIRFTGLSKEVYLSKRATEIDPNLIDSEYYQQCIRTIETGEAIQTQYFLEPTGRWLEISISRLDNDHLISIFTDITETKQAQLAIERSAKKLETIINRTHSGIFTLKPVKDDSGEIVDFRFQLVNRALAQYVHQEPEVLTNDIASKWFSAYLTNGLFELYRDTYVTGNPNRFDYHYDADGIDAWIDMMSTRFEDEVVVTFTDYTPVKQLQLELEKSVEELKRSNSSLEEFAYAASHDLQEPLRKIHLFADRLKTELGSEFSDEPRRMFEKMEHATDRMRNLINGLLAYSKVSMKPEVFKKVELDVVVQLILQDLEASINETGATIDIGKLPVVKGDDLQLRQMFQNLISNAIKYHKPGTAPKISISSRMAVESDNDIVSVTNVRGCYHVIEITDNGIGFDNKDRTKIFQVFQRLHGRSQYEGTGIGLAIVSKVVTNHKGFITADAEPGKGATFRIFLPK